jgi:hypothetical protein
MASRQYVLKKPFVEGLARVSINGKWGFIDTTGKEIISAQYDEAISFEDGYARVKFMGQWGVIDKKGNTVVPFLYYFIEKFMKEEAFAYKVDEIIEQKKPQGIVRQEHFPEMGQQIKLTSGKINIEGKIIKKFKKKRILKITLNILVFQIVYKFIRTQKAIPLILSTL